MRIAFTDLIDLAAEAFGGKALSCSDEFFAGKENLLKPGRGEFIPGKYTENGKWMDGWESRRRRTPGFDWCVIRLGMAGVIRGVDVDTNHFTGNYPEYCSIEASKDEKTWVEILPKSLLQGGSQNLFPIASEERFTHVRLNIFPDGGVARFRVHGEVRPDWKKLSAGGAVDLAAAENGGTVVVANDMYFGPKDNLIMPGRATHMGEGWETRRKRRAGHDWIVVKLGAAGAVKKIEVDTNHFKGNFPDMCSIEGAELKDPGLVPADFFDRTDLGWEEILPRTKLRAHTQHYFEKELKGGSGKFTHVRLNIFPDGGISRLRVHGVPDAGA